MPAARIKIEKGMRSHRLVALQKGEPSNSGHPRWICLCDCGQTTLVRQSHFAAGTVKTCGCLVSENSRAKSTKHGGYGSPEYQSWRAMKSRCLSPSHRQYASYGGRGIAICPQWLDFANFREDMGERPKGTTLDRKNNALGYSPDNCRWATPSEQSNNRGESNTRITFEGLTMTVAEWCKLLGVPYERVIARLSSGRSFVDAMTSGFYVRATR